MSKQILLPSGHVCLVDDDYVQENKWHISSKGYAKRHNGTKFVFMHTEIIGKPPAGMVTDHINGNKLDNRKCNLRFVTNQQNLWNSKPRGAKSGLKGVYRENIPGEKKYRAFIRVDGKRKSLGYYLTANEAGEAYDRAARRYFGKFARTNF